MDTADEFDPDWGTGPWAELPAPQGLVLAVFRPSPIGASTLVLFGPLSAAATDHDMESLLARARAEAESSGGTVVKLSALADYSYGVRP